MNDIHFVSQGIGASSFSPPISNTLDPFIDTMKLSCCKTTVNSLIHVIHFQIYNVCDLFYINYAYGCFHCFYSSNCKLCTLKTQYSHNLLRQFIQSLLISLLPTAVSQTMFFSYLRESITMWQTTLTFALQCSTVVLFIYCNMILAMKNLIHMSTFTIIATTLAFVFASIGVNLIKIKCINSNSMDVTVMTNDIRETGNSGVGTQFCLIVMYHTVHATVTLLIFVVVSIKLVVFSCIYGQLRCNLSFKPPIDVTYVTSLIHGLCDYCNYYVVGFEFLISIMILLAKYITKW